MKLITFEIHGQQHIGALIDKEAAVDLTASDDDVSFGSMLNLIDGGAEAFKKAKMLIESPVVTVSLADIVLRSPIPIPRQMRDFLGFEKHLRQARANRHLFGITDGPRDPDKVEIPAIWLKQPGYFKCNRFSVIGHGEEIVWPSYAKIMDYELEFAAIIGKTGKNISKNDAREHIFGYTIFNDVSARDAQMEEWPLTLGPAKGKDFDTGNVLGPWLVTADEVPDPYNLPMVVRINGEERGRGNSSEMHFKFEDYIVHVSRDETLYAGEILGSGVVGNGSGFESGRFLRENDIIELEVGLLGILKNQIVRKPNK